MPRIFGLSLLLLGACRLIPDTSIDAASDPDHDGVPLWEDCDNWRPEVTTPDTVVIYPDDDGDGWGDAAGAYLWTGSTCPKVDELAGLAEWGGDCDDADGTSHPDATEACDGRDNDCDGAMDEGGSCLVQGETSLSEQALQTRGADEADRAGFALAGGVDLDGDGVMDGVVASLGARGTSQGMVHILQGPLSENTAFAVQDTGVLYDQSALGGDADGSPNAAALAFAELGAGPVVLIGAPLDELAADAQGSGDVWLASVADGDISLSSLRDQQALDGTLARLGWALASAPPDIDGAAPGVVLLGAPGSSPVDASGYPVTGGGAVVVVPTLDGAAGDAAVLAGADPGAWLGATVAAGDLDGDGCADGVVGQLADGAAGPVSLVLGICTLEPGEHLVTDLVDATFAEPELIEGGGQVAALTVMEDVTGDKYNDLVIGAPRAPNDTYVEAGVVWLIRGASTVDSSFSDPSARFFLDTAHMELGAAATAVGDLDADGNLDLALGAPGDSTRISEGGSVWVVYGPAPMAGTAVNLADAQDDVPALRIDGAIEFGRAGASLAPAGIGPDGKGDAMLIGAPYADFGEQTAVGRVYLFSPG